MAGDLLETADDLGIERFSAVGHSMGGKTVMEAALSAPERIASLAVVDIAPVAYEPRFVDFLRALQTLDLRAVEKKSDADLLLKDSILDPDLRHFFLTNLVRSSDGTYSWRIDLDGISLNYPALWGALAGGRSYRGPALFIRGSGSDYISEAQLSALQSFFPASSCATIEGAGHWVATDKPEAFLSALSGFLFGALQDTGAL